ncbi:MAG: hypothetical protein RIR11_36 [Bacteroidota bacterium]
MTCLLTNPFLYMFDRIIRNFTQNGKNETVDNQGKSSLDELAENSQILDKDKMSRIEGGHTNNQHFNDDRLDITSMPGGGTPS